MTALQVRKLRWAFDEATPFQWNRANPAFGVAMNSQSFIAPEFERYIVAATRMAMSEITDPEMRAEADAFLTQEALHAGAHRSHVAALVRQYPGLKQVVDELDARYERLLQTRPLRYHLAYVADIEATFTPFFDMILRHRDTLLDNGDHRVAPIFLWHFVEEIEHRCSAQLIYHAVVPSPWYRLRVMPGVFAHVLECSNVVCRGFDQHVPAVDRGMNATDMLVGLGMIRALFRRARPSDPPSQFAAVSWKEIATLLHRLARSQRPGHSPANEQTPPFADEWFDAYDAGRDVVRWYGGEPGAR
jgi:predicted metal-dependent hydrolase